MSQKLLRRVGFVLTLLFLSGCTALVVGDVSQGGYSVSQRDSALITVIERQLKADSVLGSATLTAYSVEGHVTLHGQVSSRSQEARAVKLARSVSGVRKVVSKITVTSP